MGLLDDVGGLLESCYTSDYVQERGLRFLESSFLEEVCGFDEIEEDVKLEFVFFAEELSEVFGQSQAEVAGFAEFFFYHCLFDLSAGVFAFEEDDVVLLWG